MPIIGFEGLDGVGKTSAANQLAWRRGALIVTQIGVDTQSAVERRAVNTGNDVEARFDYFLGLNRAQMVVAQEVAALGRLVITESTVIRTVATHRVLGSERAMAYEIEEDLLPDFVIRLDLDQKTRIERIIARDGFLKHSSDWDKTLYERREELAAEYDSFGLITMNANQPVNRIVDVVESIAGLPVSSNNGL
jgi:thymidylate kinase